MSNQEKNASGIVGLMTGGALGNVAGQAVGELAGLTTGQREAAGYLGASLGAGYGTLKGLEHKRKMRSMVVDEDREKRLQEMSKQKHEAAIMKQMQKSAAGELWRSLQSPVSSRAQAAQAARQAVTAGGGVLARMQKAKEKVRDAGRAGLEAGAMVARAGSPMMTAHASIGMSKEALFNRIQSAIEKGKEMASKGADAWRKAQIFGPPPPIREKTSSASLTKIAMEIYSQGHVRDEVMKHACNQAAHIKASCHLEEQIKLAGLRLALFGAVSPTLEKIAEGEDGGRWHPAAEGFLKGIGQAGAQLLAQGAVQGARWLMSREAQNIEESYQTMLKSNPEFKRNEQVVRGHFDVLKQFAPSVASNPVAAAGHVRQAVEMGNMIPIDTVRNLAQTEKLHQESGPKSWLSLG